MLQIKNTLGGGGAKVTIDGVKVKDKLDLITELMDVSGSTLPYNFYYGCAVVLNNEIHILGGYYGSSGTSHYKWDGSSWTSVSTLPYEFYKGCAVVLNGEIHILGSGNSSYNRSHYKWDGASWTSVSTIPYRFYSGSAVVLNNEISILGSENGTSTNLLHYILQRKRYKEVA